MHRSHRRRTPIALTVALVAGLLAAPAAAQDAPQAPDACPDGAPSAGFGDVASTNVHNDNIDCAVERNLLSGTSTVAGLFSPWASTTRGQMASLLAQTLDEADVTLPAASDVPFEDATGSVHAANISRISAAGIIVGRGDGSFGPSIPVTRAQMASMVVGAYEYALGLPQPASSPAGFADTTGSVHAGNIDAAVEIGLLLGRSESTFEPGSATRRDQIATVVTRLLATLEGLPEPSFVLTVLHANDGESALLPDEGAGFPGAARFVADMLALQAAASAGDDADVVTISSGDNFLAGPRLDASLAGLDDDGPFYDALVYNVAGFDAMTIGNHEFDFGPDLLAQFIEAVDDDIPFLSANLDVSGEAALVALGDRIAASTVIERGDRQIGVVGATYEDLASISSPRGVETSAVLAAVQAEVDTLIADGVDHILLSSHLQNLNEELALIPQLSGVDAVIGGGGGEALRDQYPLFAVDSDGRQVPVVTTPGNYTDIGRLVLGFDDDGELVRIDRAASHLVEVEMSGARNTTIADDVETPVAAYVSGLAANVLGTTEVPLDGRRDSVRTRETNLGSLLADAMLFAARGLAADYGVPEADVALQNGGGIRNDGVIPIGDVTELDTFNVAAFVNFTSVAQISGADLAAVVEHSIAMLPESAGQHGQWAGVEFTFDVSEDPGERIVDATVTRADDTTVDLVVDGVVVGGAETFTIASINFLFDGGDSYPFPDDITYQQLPVTYQVALANRIAALGTITAAEYPNLTVEADLYDRFGPVAGTFL